MYDSAIHHRRSIRLPGQDYAEPGYYFVTICTKEGVHSFGDVTDERMSYRHAGYLAKREIQNINNHSPSIRVDAFIVMPNHVHVIIHIKPRNAPVGARFIAPQAEAVPQQYDARFIAPQAEAVPQQYDARFIAPRSAIKPQPSSAFHHIASQVPQNDPIHQDGPTMNNDRGAMNNDRGAMNNDRGAMNNDRGAMNRAPTVGDIVRAYKARCTYYVRRSSDPFFGWQRNYYERIIRDERGLSAVREYIRLNPERWGH